MPLTQEQFKKARDAGYTVEQIAKFEKKRQVEQPQQQAQPELAPKEDRFDPLLPGKQRVKQRISERQDPLAGLLDMAKNPNIGKAFAQGSQRVSKGQFPIDVGQFQNVAGGVTERGRAGIGNLGMSIQEHGLSGKEFGKAVKEGTPLAETGVSKAGMEIIKGLTGEKFGTPGDIGVMAGMPEPLADIADFFSFIGASNLLSKGKLIDGAKKTVRASKATLTKKAAIKQYKNKQYNVNKAKEIMGGLDDVHDGISNNYDAKWNSIADDLLPEGSTVEGYAKLPKNILNKISLDKSLRRYPDGKIIASKGNVNKVRGIIRRSVPSKVWNGKAVGDVNTANLQDVYFDFGDLVAQGDDELLALNRQYRDYMKMRKVIYDVVTDSDGNPMGNGLKNLFTSKGDQGIKNFFTGATNPATGQVETVGLGTVWGKAGKIIKSIERHNKKQFVLNWLEKTIGLGGAAQAGRRVVQRGF